MPRQPLEDALIDLNVSPKPKKASPHSMRDDFAMAALEHATNVYTKMSMAEMDRIMGRKNYSKDEIIARLAYNMADAMLIARES